MSQKRAKQNRRENKSENIEIKQHTYNDPNLSEYCSTCIPKVLAMVQYVRDLENVQIVAKQALESMSLVSKKLEKQNFDLRVENGRLMKKEIGTEGKILEGKMDKIDNQVNRLATRKKMGVES